MTIFLPYFFYAMTMEIINDFLDDNDNHKK
jgi:hypothetical protein